MSRRPLTPLPSLPVASPVSPPAQTTETCVKCGNEGITPRYHKQGCTKENCSCAECSYGSHAKQHTEHLHYHCRCGFDWIGPVLA